MSSLTAEALIRAPQPWACELVAGHVHRRTDEVAQWRRAVTIARVLQLPAEALGLWVSTEALVRTGRDPDTALRPAVVVAAGDPPLDGVLDIPPVLVVELAPDRLPLWDAADVGCLWVVGATTVTVRVRGSANDRVRRSGMLRVRGARGLAVPLELLTQSRYADSR